MIRDGRIEKRRSERESVTYYKGMMEVLKRKIELCLAQKRFRLLSTKEGKLLYHIFTTFISTLMGTVC